MVQKAVFGIATAGAQAERIVVELRSAGFTSEDISVLLPDKTMLRDFGHEKHTKAPEGAATGAGTGAVVGGGLGWLIGVGSIAIPGLGPFLAAGPIISALAGAAVGAAVGGVSGALVGLGVPEFEAKQYESKLREGNILISVHTQTAAQRSRASEILVANHAHDISTVREAAPRPPAAIAAARPREALARIAMPVGTGVEDAEFSLPFERLRDAGHDVIVFGPQAGEEVHGKRGQVTVRIEQSARDLDPATFDALVIPGGYSPDHLREDQGVVDFARRFCRTGKLVAAICHGPQLLIEADCVRGRTLTSWPSVRTDLENAGAHWVDREVVIDGNLITSRKPDDLDAFCRALLAHLPAAHHPARAAS